MRATPFVSISCWNDFSMTANDTVEQRRLLRNSRCFQLALIHSTCSSNRQSELKVTHANTPTTLLHLQERYFPRFLHHYVMQKNSRIIKTVQRYLCRVLQFNRQNWMLISPLTDEAIASGVTDGEARRKPPHWQAKCKNWAPFIWHFDI